jgi:hypothetical protein
METAHAVNTRSGIRINPWNWLFRIGYVLLITLWILLSLDILWPVFSNVSTSPSNIKPIAPNSVNYLIIAPQALAQSASAWADYREATGHQTRVIFLTPNQAKAKVIQDLIQETYTGSGKPYPFYVLLIGHAHPFSSHPDTYLPSAQFFVSQDLSSGYGPNPIASDDALVGNFSSGDSRNTLPIFVGRIPARTEEEASLLLERTQQYEKDPPTGEGRARIELVTSNAGFGTQYDPFLEWALRTLLQEVLPDDYQWHMINGNPQSPYSYPIDSFPNEVANRFDSGSLAVVYVGHGQPELLGWAYSRDGRRGRILGFEDVELIENANSSVGIFTACSAGAYDLAGDNLSVVESIYLTPGGPAAVYSSSAWINGALNGRLVMDIFETLLVDYSSTLGEWVNRVEYGSDPIHSHSVLTSLLKAMIPRISGIYENKLLLSRTQARQVLDIQSATYNLFGDPALRIAYAQSTMEINPARLWQPWKGDLVFSGKSELPAGQQVLISLEALPGAVISQEDHPLGTIDGYLQANNPVLSTLTVYTEIGGEFSGTMFIPASIPSSKYLLRAVSLLGQSTYITAHPVYISWTPLIMEILSSAAFWWSLISGLFISKRIFHQYHR